MKCAHEGVIFNVDISLHIYINYKRINVYKMWLLNLLCESNSMLWIKTWIHIVLKQWQVLCECVQFLTYVDLGSLLDVYLQNLYFYLLDIFDSEPKFLFARYIWRRSSPFQSSTQYFPLHRKILNLLQLYIFCWKDMQGVSEGG